MQVELRPRTLGENIGLTFQLTINHFVKLVLLYAIIQSPLLAVQVLTVFNTEEEQILFAGLGMILVLAILAPIGTGAGTAIVAQSFTGARVTIGQALGIGLSRLGSLLAYGLITSIIIGAIPAMVVMVAFGLGAPLLALLAFPALLWPGLMFMTWYYLGNAAIIVERLGFGEAMARSKDLSENKRIEIFALFLVVTMVSSTAAGMVSGIAQALIFAFGPDFAIAAAVIGWAAGVAAGVLVLVAPVVMYFSLRCEKDGMDVTGLAELVDEIGRRAHG